MGRSTVVGLDIGTTSVKAAAYDREGREVAAAEREYPLHSSGPGRVEQDPDEVLAGVGTVLARVAADVGDRRIAGVALSSAMHTLIALDSAGQPLTPVATYADNRAGAEAEALRRSDGLALYRRTGTPMHPMSAVARLQWFRTHQPQVWRAADRWVSIKEYVLLALLGSRAVDHSVASATGLLDLERRAWDEGALGLAGVRAEQLGDLVPATAVVAGLTLDAARRTGLPRDTPFVVGAGDGVLANVGVGATRPGVVACSVGTSGAVRAVVPRPTFDPEGRLFCYALADELWVFGGAISNGGLVLRWLRDTVLSDVADDARRRGADPYEALTTLAAQAPPGAGGLLMLPSLAGERAPHWSSLPRGVLFGLQRHHGRPHLVRAAMEGVVHQLQAVLGLLESAGGGISEVRATGGFAASPLWRQVMADVLERRISVPTRAGSVFGAALLGMRALGWLDSLHDAQSFVDIAHEHDPDPAAGAVHRRLQPIFDGLHDALLPAFTALAEVDGLLPGNDGPAIGDSRLT